jgi:hypothetical protein
VNTKDLEPIFMADDAGALEVWMESMGDKLKFELTFGIWIGGNLGTVMDLAAAAGATRCVTRLLEKGARAHNPHGQTGGWDPITRAIRGGHADIVRLLVDARVRAFHKRTLTGQRTLAEDFVSGPARSKGKDYVTMAVNNNHGEILGILLAAGASPEGGFAGESKKMRQGPLETAVRRDFEAPGRLLVKSGAVLPWSGFVGQDKRQTVERLLGWVPEARMDEARDSLVEEAFKSGSPAVLRWVAQTVLPKLSGPQQKIHLKNLQKNILNSHWSVAPTRLGVLGQHPDLLDEKILCSVGLPKDSWWPQDIRVWQKTGEFLAKKALHPKMQDQALVGWLDRLIDQYGNTRSELNESIAAWILDHNPALFARHCQGEGDPQKAGVALVGLLQSESAAFMAAWFDALSAEQQQHPLPILEEARKKAAESAHTLLQGRHGQFRFMRWVEGEILILQARHGQDLPTLQRRVGTWVTDLHGEEKTLSFLRRLHGEGWTPHPALALTLLNHVDGLNFRSPALPAIDRFLVTLVETGLSPRVLLDRFENMGQGSADVVAHLLPLASGLAFAALLESALPVVSHTPVRRL